MTFVRLPHRVKSIHYAWVMLGVAIAMRLISSVERTAPGCWWPTWSTRLVSLGGAAAWWAWPYRCNGSAQVFGPPAGWLGDRYGLRLAMAVGALLFLATSVLIGLVTAPWQFILYFGILMSAALAISRCR